MPHPEERPFGRVSKDGHMHSWFETREDALLTMRTTQKENARGERAFSVV
jgi:hypothetical protein